MSKYRNKKKDERLIALAVGLRESDGYEFVARIKFNFSFLDSSQKDAYSFDDLIEIQRKKLIYKIVELSKNTRLYWENQKVGSGQHRQSLLEVYGPFPSHSNFSSPTNIPADVKWGRFRIEGDFRLAGFFVPDQMHGEEYKSGVRFDKNTFYVVFIDPKHNFYPVEK